MRNLLIKGTIILVALLTLDATVGRWLLRFTTTFRAALFTGFKPKSRRLMVYLPGILFDGEESVTEVRHALLKHFSKALFISYGFWRFLPDHVLKQTAKRIGHASGEESDYDSIVIVGASFGGRVAADLCNELQIHYGWSASALKVVMVDTPCENNSFKKDGLRVSLILRRLFIGPGVSLLISPIAKQLLVGPFDEEIEPGGNYTNDELRKIMVDRMAKFMMSSVADQSRYLADDSIEWTMGLSLSGVKVVYLMCVLGNITVVQPAAMRKVRMYTDNRVSTFESIEVESPHCAFAQMPLKWSAAFDLALAA